MADLEAGMVIRMPYPFVRGEYLAYDADGASKQKTWQPGTRIEPVYIAPDDCAAVYMADGVGEIILTVISVHKPGRFPTRVFFTRQWRSPDGKEFGKGGCRCATSEKFKRLAKGYLYPFKVEHKKDVAA